ncbi:MAG: hflK [Alphaproteobacteria bacterium]|nr:hflK [Alphaproteobacteria bacterium]
MRKILGWGWRRGASLNENKGGPWGSSGGSSDGGGGGGDGPRNPWGPPPRKGRPVGNVTSLDDFLKKSRDRFGGGFSRDGRPYWLYGLAIVALLWVVFTSMHMVGPQERGVITRLGKYAGTLGPGVGLSLPAPIDRVQKVDVEAIRTIDIGSAEPSDDNLILTRDQNLVDLAYSVRWNIRDPERYLFQIADLEETIGEVAQSAMRAVVASVTLDDAIGSGRSDIEQRVALLMQQLLDSYGAGVAVQGVAIKQSDPPAAVNDAFKEVTAAQQEAQSYINNARATALQVTAKAQGEAAAFDKVYAQYKLAPDVTRRRMYYETMEDVLSKVDKTIIEAPGVTPYLPLPEIAGRPQAKQSQ